MVQILAPVFPRYDFENGDTLLTAIGSFWSTVFEDSGRLRSEFRANGEVFLQTQLNFLEAVATVSRFECPVFHEEKWRLLILKKSSMLSEAGVLKYNEDKVYGSQPDTGQTFLYGTSFRDEFIFKVEDSFELADAPHIQNRILDPSVVLTKGIDFKYNRTNKFLTFDQDPFQNVLFAQRVVYGDDSNVISDEEIALWLPNSDFDKTFLFDHFGYALSIAAQSSQFYKDFINAVWNTLNRTADIADVRLMLTAITGVASVIEDEETVEFVIITGGKLQVITDQHVYKFKATATPLVSVGDIVTVGQELVDTVQVIELAGSNVDLSTVKALALGQEFLSNGFFSHLIFSNQITALEYLGLDSDDKAFVKFDIGGFAPDVDRFWDEVQQRGKDQGATLAELLDTRENPPTDPSLPAEITQPGPENLPLEVNPLIFMIDNLLKNNLFIIKLKPADILVEALGLEFLHVLRQVVPPHTTFIILMEPDELADVVDLEDDVDDLVIGHFTGPEAQTLDEVGVTPSADAWIESAMVRPRIVRI